jgi:helix-hairpin-helix protein
MSMARKDSHTSRPTEPPEIDDLKLINGIGPAVERRLHGVGIFTFAQLAALSPADIAAAVADLAGLSAERIIKQDWISQARRLAAGSKPTRPQQGKETESAPPVVPEPEPVAAIPEKAVPVPPVAAEPEFATPAVIPPGVKEAEITPPVAAKTRISGILRLHKIVVIQAEPQRPQDIIRHDQPFKVHLTLDLTGLVMPVDTEFHYKAFIYSQSLEGLIRQKVGEASGNIKATNSITVHVEKATLPKGVNVLHALVTLWPVKTETTPQTYLQAWSDGRLIMVI